LIVHSIPEEEGAGQGGGRSFGGDREKKMEVEEEGEEECAGGEGEVAFWAVHV